VEFQEIVRQRYSCRKFEDRKLPQATVEELLEMVRYSASARNLQPWKIRVVSDKSTLAELFEATGNQVQVRECSHLLVLCADTDYSTLIEKMDRSLLTAGVPDEVRTQSVGMTRDRVAGMTSEQLLHWSQCQVFIALGNAINGAFSLGVGASPMTNFQPPEFARMLGLPANLTPTALVALGYPAEEGAPKRRYPLSDIVI
jgi:nitroreductase